MKKMKLTKKMSLVKQTVANLQYQDMDVVRAGSAFALCTDSCSAFAVCCVKTEELVQTGKC